VNHVNVTFVGGPADGVKLDLTRTPLFLRVVREEHIAADWVFDALDQLDDAPKSTETIYVYRLRGEPWGVHYSGRDRDGRRVGRTEKQAEYEFVETQPDDATARDTAAWRAWAQAERDRQKAAEKAAEKAEEADLDAQIRNVMRARDAIVSHLGGPWRKGTPGSAGQIDCPVCGTPASLAFSRSGYNGHIHAGCSTKNCVSWME